VAVEDGPLQLDHLVALDFAVENAALLLESSEFHVFSC
jgi:hypothetical protein